jgi:hypothetical protein
VGTDADPGHIAATADRPGWFNRAAHDVVHTAQGNLPIKQIAVNSPSARCELQPIKTNARTS